VSFRFPLKDYASKLTDLRSPVGALLEISKAAAPLRFLVSPLRDPFPYAGGQPKRSISLTALEIHKRAGNPGYARLPWFMPARQPGMNHASRAAPR
jgi:hypothetical protein